MDEQKPILEPLPYHLELRDYLKSEERELWVWLAFAQGQADYAENLQVELLKATYRLDSAEHAGLYQSLHEAKTSLHLDIPVTLYQAQNSPELNAALYHFPGVWHLVFAGPLFTLLDAEEIKTVIGHELAHYDLWERDGGDFHMLPLAAALELSRRLGWDAPFEKLVAKELPMKGPEVRRIKQRTAAMLSKAEKQP